MNETFRPSPPMIAMTIAIAPMLDRGDRGRPRPPRCSESLPVADDVRPDVVRDRAGRAEHEAGDDREDRRERDRGDDRQERVAADGAGAAAELLREVRRREVAALARRLDALLARGSRARRSR